MKKLLLLFCLTIVTTTLAFADGIPITHFEVKENPFAEGEVAIVAVDTAHHILENVTGNFTFIVNGFEEQLTFDKGTAFYRHKIAKSAFMYLKHQNDSGTSSILYYIYNRNDKLTPIHISWILLLAIPCGLFLLAYMFKRFIIIAIVIFCVFLYFNHANGLGMPTFFGSVIDGLKGLF